MILQMNPPSAARALMNDLTRPLKHQLPYIKKVHGGAWVGLSLANVLSEFKHKTKTCLCYFLVARSVDRRKHANR